MPIYIYRCKNCGVQFEKKQKFSDSPLTCCPECSKKTLHKVYQPVGIVFKGSGFYATDNRSPSGSKRPSDQPKESGTKSETNTTKKEANPSSDKDG